ncbi:MAG: pyridoxal phosphate-dependent aminotransferase, partial [Xanthobacteraceae bacterium]
MLEKAKDPLLRNLIQPSGRSGVPPFMVMDVMAAAARLEAHGRRIIHM